MNNEDAKFISPKLKGFNLENSVAVSDTVNYTSSQGARCCFDKDKGKAYCVYTGSKKAYGETRDELLMSVIPIAQPFRTQVKTVLTHKDVVDGKEYVYPDVPSVLFVDGAVRIFFMSRHAKGREDPTFDETAAYYYIDYDPATDTFSKIYPVTVKWNGKPRVPFNGKNFKAYMEEKGYEVNTTESIEMEEFNFQAKIVEYEGVYYGNITSVSTCMPVVCKSEDGCKTLEFINVLPQKMRYESEFEIVKGVMYFIMRESDGANFYASYDLGKTFVKSDDVLPIAKTRPWLCEYNGELLICLSKPEIKPNFIRDGRNNLYIYKGTGLNFSKYEQLLEYVNPYGILYYDVFNYKGVLYICYSNSDLYSDKVIWGNVQGKDLVYYGKIGYITE